MNLLSLIIIFLALIICGSIGYIAWELTRDDFGEKPPRQDGDPPEPD